MKRPEIHAYAAAAPRRLVGFAGVNLRRSTADSPGRCSRLSRGVLNPLQSYHSDRARPVLTFVRLATLPETSSRCAFGSMHSFKLAVDTADFPEVCRSATTMVDASRHGPLGR